ncbi:MAG: TraL conjugative transposon family protein [Dysgonomonas mossii]|uniref:TraL conjugative transposon family protein n=1 Tax=Dysgonomonas mossii TaxID=163665 RepID=UPI0039915BEF
MKKIINKIKDWIEDRLRSICAPLSPGKRILVIVILVAIFAAVNFYITFMAIYNIGREDEKWEFVDSPIVLPDFVREEEEPTELQQEKEDFFNQHFNSEEDDTTEE